MKHSKTEIFPKLSRNKLSVALAISLGFGPTTQAQFTSELNLSNLNGNNGFEILGVSTNDKSGKSVSNAGDINSDGIDDLIIGAYKTNPSGSSYVVFGNSSGFNNSLALSALNGSNGFLIQGISNNDQVGYSVSTAGDFNGDGIDDVIIGARLAGISYIVFGNSNGFTSPLALSNLNGSNGFTIQGMPLISDVSGAGDINGDGLDDIVIGISNAPFSGASYVVFGKSSGITSTLNLSTLNGSNGFVLKGASTGDNFGVSVSNAGDVNGDGIDDIIVGANRVDLYGLSSIGASYIIYGNTSGFNSSISMSELDGSNGFQIRNSSAAGDELGVSVSSAGDINGDGLDDLMIGAYYADPNGEYTGSSYVLFGNSTIALPAYSLNFLNGSNGFRLNGSSIDKLFGGSVSEAGDVNGDGIDDIIIGSNLTDFNGNNSVGSSYIIFGKTNEAYPTPFELSVLNGSNGFAIRGVAEFDNAGISVSAAGDVNDDGIDDIIIGAHRVNSSTGSSYVVFGREKPIFKNSFEN